MTSPNFNIKAEHENSETSGAILDSLNQITDGSEGLDDIASAYKKLDLEKKSLELQTQKENSINDSELHGIRKTHLSRLFILTCVWSGVVIFILISTGLKRLWWFPLPDCLTAIPFELESSVIIAFITSTTATIISLYTIAAYWLFKKKD